MNHSKSEKGNKEFICLMALLMSMTALSIDAMLPALGQIGADLKVKNPNDAQLVISAVFLGMASGLIFYGPISDAFGRKKAIYIGVSIFLSGLLISIFSSDFTFMLVGRVLQGFGSASTRVVTVALIRDRFVGNEMGKIMSLIMMIFIMVPALAPSIGQLLLYFAHWRAIFWFMFVLGLTAVLWLHFRQPETLLPANRIHFSIKNIIAGIKETLKNPISRSYALVSGVIFGAFVGYLSSSQQVFQIQYGQKESFPLYFGGLALVIGVSSFSNSRLLKKFSMERLCQTALAINTLASFLFLLYIHNIEGDPHIALLMIYFSLIFFNVGILFGNLNTLAVQPLGHIAGIATSMISSLQTFISVAVGGMIGQMYDGTIVPMITGFFLCGLLSLSIFMQLQFKVAKLKQASG